MTLPDRIDEIRTAMSDFDGELTRLLSNRTTHVAHLDDAQTLGDLTADQVIDLLRAKIRAHIQTIGQNAHKTTPDDLGTYGKAKLDGDMAALLDVNSSAPLSFYGDREYLPPSVTGSFESAMNWAPWGGVGMFLEDNGTLMILRTGTDGSSAGVYYSYIRNALNTARMEAPVMTNTRYNPAYFPSTVQAMAILYSNDDVIIGMLMNKSTGARAGYFISLTNNTFDQTKHTGVIIPDGNFLDVIQLDQLTLRNLPCAYIKNNKLWIFSRRDGTYEGTLEMRYRVWSMNKNDLISGVFNGATQEKGWTINRGAGGVVSNSDDIVVAANFNDVVTTDVPANYTLYPANVSVPVNYAKLIGGTTGRVMGQWYINCHKNDNSISDARVHMLFSFEVPDNKVIDVSKYFVAKMVYGIVNGGINALNSPAQYRTKDTLGWQMEVNGDNHIRVYLADNGCIFTYRTWVAGTGRTVSMMKFANADIANIMQDNVARTNTVNTPFQSRFASPVSYMMRTLSNYGDAAITANNQNWNGNTLSDWMPYRVGFTSAFNYAYKSIGAFAGVLGFAPTADRKWLTELSSNIKDPRSMVNESDAGGWQVSQARFDTVLAVQTTKYAAVDANLNGSGSVSVPAWARDQLIDQAINVYNAYGVAIRQNFIPPYTSEVQRWCEVVIPQRYTDCPAFAYGYLVDTTGVARMWFCGVNVVGSRQSPSNLTLDLNTFNGWAPSASNGNTLWLDKANQSNSQVVIRRVNGGFVIGVVPAVNTRTVGDTIGNVIMMKYQGGTFTPLGDPVFYHPYSSPVGFLNFPTHGIYLCGCAENERWLLDAATKLMGVPVCTTDFPTGTLQSYFDKMDKPASIRVMLSEETVTAWTVYFADPTAAMVDGLYQQVPLTTIALNPATDANKMIYVWLTRQNGQLSYLLTQSIAIPTGYDGQLYLGYIQTNSQGIATINVTKRVTIGGKLLSPDSRGQAIPLTSGVPATAGRFNWR